ncbi:FAD-dependent monooxygenase [Streptomyces cavernicola]|uniref:FAD-dependent monooxygenase n=1 Tax=Streptomyces cavernicola TaxID=3043613 RepID=A0ABT6S550_9ACTN|nr:FAD-dependent monooxygenase [Streptomyces sp. B-S-A6]MDI3403212.1 FAD-dependent monooxygenase [Streptomyces sp. B-S-A6]
MSLAEQPQIAIVGGGIGGMAAAAFLRRAGLRAQVYEQARALTEVGAGLVVAPNVVKLLRRLDGFPQLLDRAVQLEVGWEFRRWENGQVLSSEPLAEACEQLFGERTYTVHRADLLNMLRSSVPESDVHLGRRCRSIDVNGRTTRLHFADGTTAEADVVIGADGIHSAFRDIVAEPSAPTESGLCVYRALVPADSAPAFARRRIQSLWLGPGRHLVHYPIAAGTLINLVAFAPAPPHAEESWTATSTVEEFLHEFDGWHPDLVDLIRAGGTPGRSALRDRAPLSRWTKGRVTLLGDAAHAMLPFFAQGAAQAIEDAAALATCLAATPHDPEQALDRYQNLRIERTHRLQAASRGRAQANHLPDGPEQQSRDAAMACVDPLRENEWIYGYDAESAVHTGL